MSYGRHAVAEMWRDERPVAQTPRRHSRQPVWLNSALGLVGTLALHAFLFQTIVLGSRAHKTRPPEIQGAGATLLHSDAEASMTIVVVQMPGSMRRDEDLLEDIASLGAAPKDLPIALASPDPLPSIDIDSSDQSADKDSEAAHDSGDPAVRAALFGRYTGQIDARIQRAWRRPRSPITATVSLPLQDKLGGTESFKCLTKIIQDAQGYVQEVLLLKCNGTPEWQHSLVVAINQSSPLPAPPSPTVFTNALTLTFESRAYASGSTADEYEPQFQRLTQTAVAPHDNTVMPTSVGSDEQAFASSPQGESNE